MSRWLRIAELAAVFLLVEARIWIFYQNYKITAVVIPLIILLASWRWRDGFLLKTLGLRPEWSWRGYPFLISSFCVLISVILISGIYWQPGITLSVTPSLILAGVLKYYLWALFQQLCLNGYFANGIYACTKNHRLTVFLSAILFAVIHLPNPALTVAGFFGGLASAHFFLINRNLYPLALGHALLGTSIRYFLPFSWHNNLTIGHGFINF